MVYLQSMGETHVETEGQMVHSKQWSQSHKSSPFCKQKRGGGGPNSHETILCEDFLRDGYLYDLFQTHIHFFIINI